MRSALLAAAVAMALPGMTRLTDDVFVARVAPKLWVHTTIGRLADGSPYPANGMLLETDHGSVLVDTGWSEEQGRVLLDWAQRTLGHAVVEGIVTHSHADRTGGARALAAARVSVVANPRTAELAFAKESAVPYRVLPSLTRRESVRDPLGPVLLFPGPGHTSDNLVVYFPAQNVLFGGCLVKAADAKDLGNVADAALPEWPHALAAVRRAFRGAKVVVPGHGAVGGDPLARTEALLKGK